jgi:hypothetical protein
VAKLETKKAIGQIGSWFATVDGESLPCVHDFWYSPPNYNDPEAILGHKRFEDFVAKIQSDGRVIMQKDKPPHISADNKTILEREGYIAVFKVDGLVFDASGLRFKITQRLCNLF